MRAPILQKLLQSDPNVPWWRTQRLRNALLYLLVVALCLIASLLPNLKEPKEAPLAALQRSAFDLQMQWLRDFYPRPVAVDPVLIGIDDSTIAVFPEPHTLWHAHLAKLLDALALAKPAAVGVDITLPERSYEDILPGVQLALIRSLFLIKQQTHMVLVHTVSPSGRIVPIHRSYERMLGENNFGLDQVYNDPDGVSREFDEGALVKAGPAPVSFSGQITRALGKPVDKGYIDYSRGGLLDDYITMQQVTGWLQENNVAELKRRFEGKVVLIGFIVNDLDRRKLPVALARGEITKNQSSLEQPGVFIHLQTLRSLLGAGLIKPLSKQAGWLTALLLAMAVLLRSSLPRFLLAGLLVPSALMALSLLMLQANLLLPVALWIAAFMIALIVRAVADGLETVVEKNRLKQNFAGSVSPAVMHEIVTGRIAAGTSGVSMPICVMFCDIRGFTTLSEALSPELVTNVLKRYFDRMVAVAHRHDGAIDKFTGDGMMVLFGAPKPLADACGNAVKCARGMVSALRDLNEEFKRDGLPVFEAGIGLNYGDAVVGYIGSSERHDYSAIGDTVNVASRVEGLTRRLDCQVVLTGSVKARLDKTENDFELFDCGEQPIRGHSAVRVWSLRIPADQATQATTGDKI